MTTTPRPIPAPPADRVPTTWGDDCRYCKRYRRPCGRHEATSVQLPRLTAKNAVEAIAQLRDRKARLLTAASDMLDRAQLFTHTAADVADELIGEARALLAQAERIQL